MNNFLSLNNDVLHHILSYLTPEEAASFRELCKKINQRMSAEGLDLRLWSPYINRLSVLDVSVDIPRRAGNSAALACFKRGFQKINMRQMNEINHFRRLLQKGKIELSEECYSFLQDSYLDARTLKELEYRNHLLDNINEQIIMTRIQEGNTTLDLHGCNLSRIPNALFEYENLQKYWQSLQTLYCSNNMIENLPIFLGSCISLKELCCFSNKLQTLPDSLGNCSALKVLNCSANQLRALPNSIGQCKLLDWIDCSSNKLQVLPPSLRKCSYINLTYNQFQILPDFILEERTKIQCSILFRRQTITNDKEKMESEESRKKGCRLF